MCSPYLRCLLWEERPCPSMHTCDEALTRQTDPTTEAAGLRPVGLPKNGLFCTLARLKHLRGEGHVITFPSDPLSSLLPTKQSPGTQ